MFVRGVYIWAEKFLWNSHLQIDETRDLLYLLSFLPLFEAIFLVMPVTNEDVTQVVINDSQRQSSKGEVFEFHVLLSSNVLHVYQTPLKQ